MRPVLVVVAVLLAAGCARVDGPLPTNSTTPGGPTPGATTPAATVATPPATPDPTPYEPRFDGALAYEHVLTQISGPNATARYRIPGTETNTEVAQEITGVMRGLGYEVGWHQFNATYGCQETPMHNVVATRAGTSGRTVVFAAHYDTRPIADKDPDASMRAQPVLGANDGASGVAVLLELARVLPPSNDSVRMLFFDGEDGGGNWNRCTTQWILGSTAYAETLTETDVASIRALVLVDMVGDRDLVLPKEGYTAANERAAPLQEDIYDVGQALGHDDVFLDRIGPQITDDHVPFLARQIPAVDLIHLIPGDPRVFPDWHHTTFDDAASVSADSLAIVGQTLEVWFAQLERG